MFHIIFGMNFRAGDTIDITIAAIAGTYTIASVDRDNNEILITGSFPSVGTSSTVWEGIIGTVNAYWPISKTFAQERFHTQNNLRFVMMWVVYTYTGGFNSDTLTGITPTLPAVIPDGTIIYSDIIETTPTGNDYPTGATPDILSVAKNQAYIAQSTRNWVWLSKQDDYTSYTYTTPLRIFGEWGGVRLDNNIRAIVTNQEGTVEVSAEDVWYPITLVSVTTSGIPGEEVRVWVPKSGAWIGANNQFSVANTRNGIIFLSNEPTLEYLVNTLQTIATPLSDPIKTDFQNWNMDGVKCLYWKSYLWVLIPQESILIGYDLIRNFWQPPQIIAGNTLSIIEGWLVVHSSSQNESYRMFVGTNDNGNPFIQRSVYTYREGSSRAEYQVSGGYFVEAKVTAQTDEIRFVCQTGYKWSVDKFEYTFGSQDWNPYVDTPLNTPWFGWVGFGERPFGSFFTTDDEVQYRKVRRIFPITKNSEFFEMQVYFECDKLDAQFKIVSHGEQMLPSGSHNSELIKI